MTENSMASIFIDLFINHVKPGSMPGFCSSYFDFFVNHTAEVACFLMRLAPQAALGSRTWSSVGPPLCLA